MPRLDKTSDEDSAPAFGLRLVVLGLAEVVRAGALGRLGLSGWPSRITFSRVASLSLCPGPACQGDVQCR